MTILAECPSCHKKNSLKNGICTCGYDIENAKQRKKVLFWIVYYQNGKQKRGHGGYTLKEAKEREAEKKYQKQSNNNNNNIS